MDQAREQQQKSFMTSISFLTPNILSVTNWILLARYPTSWLKTFRNVPDIAKSNVCRSGQFRIKPSDSIHCRPLGFVSYFPAFLFTICRSTPATVPISFLVDSSFLFFIFEQKTPMTGGEETMESKGADTRNPWISNRSPRRPPTAVLNQRLFCPRPCS